MSLQDIAGPRAMSRGFRTLSGSTYDPAVPCDLAHLRELGPTQGAWS